MVPQKATKTTNATLCHIPPNSQNCEFLQNGMAKINGVELFDTKLFQKSFNVNESMADVIRPIFSQKFHILTYICEKKIFLKPKNPKKSIF